MCFWSVVQYTLPGICVARRTLVGCPVASDIGLSHGWKQSVLKFIFLTKKLTFMAHSLLEEEFKSHISYYWSTLYYLRKHKQEQLETKESVWQGFFSFGDLPTRHLKGGTDSPHKKGTDLPHTRGNIFAQKLSGLTHCHTQGYPWPHISKIVTLMWPNVHLFWPKWISSGTLECRGGLWALVSRVHPLYLPTKMQYFPILRNVFSFSLVLLEKQMHLFCYEWAAKTVIYRRT